MAQHKHWNLLHGELGASWLSCYYCNSCRSRPLPLLSFRPRLPSAQTFFGVSHKSARRAKDTQSVLFRLVARSLSRRKINYFDFIVVLIDEPVGVWNKRRPSSYGGIWSTSFWYFRNRAAWNSEKCGGGDGRKFFLLIAFLFSHLRVRRWWRIFQFSLLDSES